MRTDREDLRRQADAVVQSRLNLTTALGDLSSAAKKAARGMGELESVYAATNAVRRAEEAHDIALLDLNTARGEDA